MPDLEADYSTRCASAGLSVGVELVNSSSTLTALTRRLECQACRSSIEKCRANRLVDRDLTVVPASVYPSKGEVADLARHVVQPERSVADRQKQVASLGAGA